MPAVAKQDLMVVVTSVGTEDQALDVAHALVRSRRAACVNIIPNVHSVYRWKGRVCDDGEMLLIIKTRASNFESVRETIHKVNTYELPEVMGYRVDWASPGFSSWIDKMTTARKRKVENTPEPAPRRPAPRATARPVSGVCGRPKTCTQSTWSLPRVTFRKVGDTNRTEDVLPVLAAAHPALEDRLDGFLALRDVIADSPGLVVFAPHALHGQGAVRARVPVVVSRQ